LPSTGGFQKRYKTAIWPTQTGPVPSAQTDLETAMSAISTNDLHRRLGQQLQALSQVGEALTLRLLELEERLDGLESQLQALQQDEPGSGDESGRTNALLASTEERIAHLEGLLSEQSRLRVLPGHQANRAPRTDTAPLHGTGSPEEEPEAELNPFPEEEEQTFMDELSA
jgi:hypothetical protein